MIFKKIKFHNARLITYIMEKTNIRNKKNLIKKVNLTDEQKKSIDEIWIKNYGKKLPYHWHRLYTYYTGKFDKNYFPEMLFKTTLLNKLNPPNRKRYMDNKILTKYYFGNIGDCRLAKNYIYNCSGYFYNENGIITLEEAIQELYNIGEVVIKPIVESDSGKNVCLLNIKQGIDVISDEKIENILKKYKENYMIQEKIIQHKDFAKLNPTSVNTVRINTYICEGKVYTAPVAMRLGRNGSFVDNAHAGGITIGIKEDGTLRKYAFYEMGEKFDVHPDTKVKFEGYKIPKVHEMIEFAKKYHYRLPHMGIVAWDFTVDENENIVIIEVNLRIPSLWFPQYANGEAFFGENTEKMIKMLKEKDKELL